MRTRTRRIGRRANSASVAGIAVASLLGLSTAGATSAADDPVPIDAVVELQQRAGASVEYHAQTGLARFIGADGGRPVANAFPDSASASPDAAARSYMEIYGPAFGLSDPDSELEVMSVRSVTGGRSVVRYQQVQDGVPVLGGEIVLNLDAQNNLLSASGEIMPSSGAAPTPLVSPSEARAAALESVAKSETVSASELVAGSPELWWFDSRVLGGPGLNRPTLVWRANVISPAGQPIDQLVLVDAQLGNVVLQITQIEHGKNRVVCDANNTTSRVPCNAPYARSEGGPVSPVSDVNDAYDFAGDTYDFYAGLGRDSIDDAGMTLTSTVRYCSPTDPCPYANAFWNGSQMVYGAGFSAADDVVAHEFTHGLTDFTSRLFYYYQSGAINESLSDVFGEFVDLTNGAGTDTPAVRWLLGEDIPGIGAIRDMENPTAFGDPDRMTSAQYYVGTGDNGGVHINSGVNNKATSLMTDGGTFNGQTVTGIGIPKASAIYYEVESNLLTSASDYADLATALNQACSNLVGTVGITTADCNEVASAVVAVEMQQLPPGTPDPTTPICAAGDVPSDLFFDDLENTASGNWTAAGSWYYPQNPNPIIDATFATSGVTNFWGYDQGSTGDYSITMANGVAIPAASSAYLRFAHSYGFEVSGGTMWDGGVLEYSTNGGANWIDAGPLPADNGYNGTIAGTNPLGSRAGFVDDSGGYISSRFDLASLGGQTVQIRFRIGTDSSVDDYGWFVDDIHIYTCDAPLNPATIGNRVWDDADNNGRQSAGEVGISGVTVDLIDPSDNVLDTTTTSPNGFWYFDVDASTDHRIQVTAPSGYTFTTQHVGNTNGDSNADASGISLIPAAQLTPGTLNATFDTGLASTAPQPATIGNRVWDDADNNGRQSAGEVGISGVTVDLIDPSDNVLDTTTTSPNGFWYFDVDASTDHRIQVTAPSGYTFTTQHVGNTNGDSNADASGISLIPAAQLTPGTLNATFDTGLASTAPQPATIGNRVWDDADNNGRQSAGEVGISGVTVDLIDPSDNVLDTTTTSPNGFWYFDVDASTDHRIQVTAPSGYTFTTQHVGNTNGDSNADASGISLIPAAQLTPGTLNATFDTGLASTAPQPATIGNRVWDDADNNGRQSAGEVGISGVTVDLIDPSDNVLDTTTTSPNGFWYFDVDASTDHRIQVTAPSGYTFTTQHVGNTNGDSNADASGISLIPAAQLTPGTLNATFDTGLISTP